MIMLFSLLVSIGSFGGWLLLVLFGSRVPYLNLSLSLCENLFFGLGILGMLYALRHQQAKRLLLVSTFLFSLFQLVTGGHFWLFYWWVGAMALPTVNLRGDRAKIEKKLLPYIQRWRAIEPHAQTLFQRHFRKILFLVLLAITFTFYKEALNLYFQGDEWYHFQKYQESVSSSWWFIYGLVRVFQRSNPLGFHMSPFHEWITLWLFRIFGLRFLPYVVTFLVVHAFNGLLVYVFTKQLTKKTTTSVLAALFFTISVAHQQAFTWAAAAPATTLAVMWVLLCLIFLFKFFESDRKKELTLSFLFLLLSLMTKETGLMLVPVVLIFYALYRRPYIVQFFKELWGVWLSILIFASIRYFFAPISTDAAGVPFDPMIGLSIFRYFSFSLKGFSQMYVPSQVIRLLSIWITDMQFPFFNAEKPVQGTNYVNFTQGPAYELISYCLSFIFLLILSWMRLPKKALFVGVVIFFAGIIPLVGLTYVFPFWGYTPSIDSRHIYHLSIAAAIFFALVIDQLATFFTQRTKKSQKLLMYSACLLVLFGAWSVWQYNAIHMELQQLLPDAIQRKKIVAGIQNSVGSPPKKMIIYVKSDHSYYGFNTKMLPFQTAFSHMLPVLFSKPYNSNGIDYPQSFFGDDYLPTGGLVSQGYFEDQGYGLGFFLEKVPLVKTLEKYNYGTDMIYSFDYNGDTYDMAPTNKEFREQVTQLIDSRMQFRNWKRFGKIGQMMTFQADPNWTVTATQSTYAIKDKNGPILDIEVVPKPENAIFSVWVGEQLFMGKKMGTHYLTSYILPDLDQPHIILGGDLDKDFFGATGHDKIYYHFKISNKKEADRIFRTMEFVDAGGEEISLPTAEQGTQ